MIPGTQHLWSWGDLICLAKLQQPAPSEFIPSSVEDPVLSQPKAGLVERILGVGGRTDRTSSTALLPSNLITSRSWWVVSAEKPKPSEPCSDFVFLPLVQLESLYKARWILPILQRESLRQQEAELVPELG